MIHIRSVYKICTLKKHKLGYNGYNSTVNIPAYLKFNKAGNLKVLIFTYIEMLLLEIDGLPFAHYLYTIQTGAKKSN